MRIDTGIARRARAGGYRDAVPSLAPGQRLHNPKNAMTIGGLGLHTDTVDPVPVPQGTTVLDKRGAKATVLSAMHRPGTAAPMVLAATEGLGHKYRHPHELGLKWVLMGATYAG